MGMWEYENEKVRKCENGEMLDSPALDFTTERTDASGVIHENLMRISTCEATA